MQHLDPMVSSGLKRAHRCPDCDSWVGVRLLKSGEVRITRHHNRFCPSPGKAGVMEELTLPFPPVVRTVIFDEGKADGS